MISSGQNMMDFLNPNGNLDQSLEITIFLLVFHKWRHARLRGTRIYDNYVYDSLQRCFSTFFKSQNL